MAGDPAWPAPTRPAGEEAPGGDAWAPPAVESWKTAVAPRRGSSFAATSRLDALSADAGKDDGVDSEDGTGKAMEASLSAGKGDGRRVIRVHTGGRLACRAGVIIFYIRWAQISAAWGLIPPTDEPQSRGVHN